MELCACCKEGFIEYSGSFDICPVCGWESDGVQEDEPDLAGGANALSLNDYRSEFKAKRKADPNYTWKKELKELIKSQKNSH